MVQPDDVQLLTAACHRRFGRFDGSRNNVVDSHRSQYQAQLAGAGSGNVQQVVDQAADLADLAFDDGPNGDDILGSPTAKNAGRRPNRCQRVAQFVGNEREDFHLPDARPFDGDSHPVHFRRGPLELLLRFVQLLLHATVPA